MRRTSWNILPRVVLGKLDMRWRLFQLKFVVKTVEYTLSEYIIHMALSLNASTINERKSLNNFSDKENSFSGDVNEETRKLIEKIFFIGLTLPGCCLGIPTNIINCMVFRRQGLQDRINLCLFSLALVDCVHLMCTCAVYPVSAFLQLHDEALGDKYYINSFAILVSLLYGLRTSSTFIGVVIAVERCLCVVLPLRASTLIRTRTMGMMILVSVIFFQIFFTFYSLLFEGTWTKWRSGEHWLLVKTRFFNDNEFLVGIITIFLGITLSLAAFLILIVMTTVTVIKLKAAMKWRQQAAGHVMNNSSKETAVTLMLVLVSTVYIVTMVPYLVCQITYYLLPDPFNTSYNAFLLLKNISHGFGPVNSCFHMFIYYSRSSRFRQTFKAMFGLNWNQRAAEDTVTHTLTDEQTEICNERNDISHQGADVSGNIMFAVWRWFHIQIQTDSLLLGFYLGFFKVKWSKKGWGTLGYT